MHLSGVILKIASLEVGLEKFHTHKRVGLGLVIVVINTPKATKRRFNPTQHDEWHVGQTQHRNFPKQQNPTMSPFNSARTKNHQTTDHSLLTNLTHRDASMHAYAHHRDLNILSCQSVHKKMCSIYFLHPMDIIHHTNTQIIWETQNLQTWTQTSFRCLGWIKAQVKQGIPDLDLWRFWVAWTPATKFSA